MSTNSNNSTQLEWDKETAELIESINGLYSTLQHLRVLETMDFPPKEKAWKSPMPEVWIRILRCVSSLSYLKDSLSSDSERKENGKAKLHKLETLDDLVHEWNSLCSKLRIETQHTQKMITNNTNSSSSSTTPSNSFSSSTRKLPIHARLSHEESTVHFSNL